MKKIFLLLSTSLVSFCYAQMVLATESGANIANGQIFTYNTTVEDLATLHYRIKNTSSTEPINVRIKIVSIQNSTGSNFQFCYLNTCLPSVYTNAVYPSNSNPPIPIPANSETSAAGYTMWNSNLGFGIFPIDYVIKFYQVDGLNNEIGTPTTITYRYNPNAILAVDSIKSEREWAFVEIPETFVRNNIEVRAKENCSYEIYNMEGRSVLSGNIKKGGQLMDVSTLDKAAYIIRLKSFEGKIISKKFIKN